MSAAAEIPKFSTVRIWAEHPDGPSKPDVLVAHYTLILPELVNVRIELERGE